MESYNPGQDRTGSPLSRIQGNPDKAVKARLGVESLGKFETATPKEKQVLINQIVELRKRYDGEDQELFMNEVFKLLGIPDNDPNNRHYGDNGPLKQSLADMLKRAGISGSKDETLH